MDSLEALFGFDSALVFGICGSGDIVGSIPTARVLEQHGLDVLLGGIAWEPVPKDTRPGSRSFARFADGSSVLVHDCAYYDEEEMNHATPHQLSQTLADVDIDELYLTHFYPDAAANADAMRLIVS